MLQEKILQIIKDQREIVESKLNNHIIDREIPINLNRIFSQPNLLLIKGPRRCGKTIFALSLVKNEPFQYVNFDDERLTITVNDLNLILESLLQMEPFKYLILDEIQNIEGWEKFVSRIRDKYNVIVTGSNANLLSKQFGTHLTGRYISKLLLPFSFKEYLKFNNYKITPNPSTNEEALIKKNFNNYLKIGGYPEALIFGKEFLINLFESIVTRDISLKNIKYFSKFKRYAMLLLESNAKIFSINKISKLLKITPPTLENYTSILEDSYLLFRLNKFSYKLKEQELSLKKLYFYDTGLVNTLSLKFSENKGKLLENLVAIELKRRNKEIYYYKGKQECDFLIKQGTKITEAIQVCYELNEDNRKRELKGLREAMKEFKLKKGLLLTYNQEDTINNITIKPVWKWLLQKS